MENQKESHLEHYLRYYNGLHKPGYAVLVTGEWGTGKSYQVKSFLEKLDSGRKTSDRNRPENHIYVSLFGKTSGDEIDLAVVSKMSKVASKFAGLFKSGASATLSTPIGNISLAGLNGAAGLILENQLSLDPVNTIVFDDLERSNICPKILLGVINRYVEHLGFRVILIAHDEKIVGNFAEAKEKLIGQTIRIEPQIDEAWNGFVVQQSSGSKTTFIREHSAIILKSFSDSGVKSLRILRHIIEDVGRLHDAMSEKQIENRSASAQLIEWFVTVNAMVRNGTLTREQIPTRYKGESKSEDEKFLQQLVTTASRLGLYGNLFATEMICDGHYDIVSLQRVLEKSFAFSDPSDIPAWIKVWNRRRIDFDESAEAIEKLQSEFQNLMHDDPGVVMHMFALRIDLAKNNLLPGKTAQSIEGECETYIDSLALVRRLPNDEAFWRGSRSNLDDIESHGYGFMGVVHRATGNPEGDEGRAVRRLFEFYKNAVIKALDAAIPEQRTKLFELLYSDIDQFQTTISTGEFRQTPVFKDMAVSEFVDVILKVPHENWHRVTAAIRNRYQERTNRSALAIEFPWLLALDAEIEQRATLFANSNELADRLRGEALSSLFPRELREWLMSHDLHELLEPAKIAELT